MKPKSGRGRLRITTDGATVNQGVAWNQAGAFKAGRTYRVRGWLSGTSGHAARVYLGCGSCGSNGFQDLTTTGTASYLQIDVSWAPATDQTGSRSRSGRATARPARTACTSTTSSCGTRPP